MSKSTKATALTTSNEVTVIDQPGKLFATQVKDPNNVMESAQLKKKGITYPTPKEIFKDLDLLTGADSISLQGDLPLILVNGSEQTAYQRASLLATWKVDDEISYEMGILYALDLQIPKLKVFSGHHVHACLNQHVMGFDTMSKFDLTSNDVTGTIRNTIIDIQNRIDKTKEFIKRAKALTIDPKQFPEIIGRMTINNVSKSDTFGSTFYNYGLKMLCDPNSQYYYKQDGFSLWQFMNAFSENIKKANFFDIPDKSRDCMKQIEMLSLN